MLGTHTLIFGPTVAAALAAVLVGFAAFWSNPWRSMNRAFFSGSVHVAVWLLCVGMAVKGGEHGQIWLRTATVVGAFIAVHLWLIKETIVRSSDSIWAIICRGRYWLMGCCVLAGIVTSEWFVATQTTKEIPRFGGGYYAYIVGVLTMYALLCYQTIRQIREHAGLMRLELQLVLFGGSAAGAAVISLMALRAMLKVPWLIGLQAPVILLFYTATTIAITTNRIFNARQILLVGAQRIILISVVAGGAYVIDGVSSMFLPEPFGIFATTAVALWFAAVFNSWLDRIFHFYPEAVAARQAAFAVARRETGIKNLESAYSGILKGWGQSEFALILSGAKDSLSGMGVELSEESMISRAMRQLRWATPERLARERPTPERTAVAKFLKERGLGVLAIGEGPTLTVVIGVGVPVSRRPFTYPQVTQLLELGSIIESALERAHFSVKAQHAEQLATVGLLGASLAHEIRNPLVTIKTFVQLLPKHYQDAVFRDKFFTLIGDEVTRIDRLTEQLLDLASPRAYSAESMELHPVLRASLELVTAKAADKQIAFLTDFQASPDRVFTDASAAKQVLLNLCFNAIQAVEKQNGDRWVKVATRRVPTGLEMLVADSGPGISEEIRPRLFQPFQSTKSSGFGLGLAICSDILAGLDATITVDPTVAGCGASFRVVFPCPA